MTLGALPRFPDPGQKHTLGRAPGSMLAGTEMRPPSLACILGFPISRAASPAEEGERCRYSAVRVSGKRF